ncbi:reverse transcriptase [Gossypium australe]|uniref:Reverse transcriptase n=1 Tax=Gossypium australe TaxID=47621 RepID=A0A5B6VZW1_9ROSI|nr:reverse transcriptase [Gossypium australe]
MVDRLRPLCSAFLQCHIRKGLSTLMQLVVEDGLICGAKASRRGSQIPHLLFADNCFLFGKVIGKGAYTLKGIFKKYERVSGQCVNFDKSTIFYSTNTLDDNKRTMAEILGMRSSTDSERYLGLPNIVERCKKTAFKILKDRFKQWIDEWSIRFLSYGGKEVFIKFVSQAIAT